ncbi:unnamed protein product [Angiostrongylus costaricensis]|uniref:Elongation factor EFG domain-containing protein n=1 Tax=Angiostrongylus costaricensis TaxID=334426 RepID=A0A3P7HCE0_ANGCS|nr:unnamed protein product [Angiostrongylus costaricensis]
MQVQVKLPPDTPNLRGDWLKAINEGCCNAVHNGPVLGFPVQDVVITLKAITTSGGRVNPAVLSSCAHKCVTEAFKCANARLVEPIVQVDIVLGNGAEAHTVLHELTRRRADINNCCGTHLGTTIIRAHMPVSEMTGFPTTLRTLSSGLASLHVQIANYQIVSVHDQITIVNRLKGLKNMMDELAFLIKGYDGVVNSRDKFKWLCYMFEVCREKPVRLNGEKVSADFLHASLLIRLHHLGREEVRSEVNDLLNHLREFDAQLYYFVLVATYRLSDKCLSESLGDFAGKKWQHFFDLPTTYHDSSYGFSPVPCLFWDITPVLNDDLIVPDLLNEDPIQSDAICPLDSRGVITDLYSELLSSDALRIVDREGGSSYFLCFGPQAATLALLDMFAGVSSDIFQEEDGNFYLANNCKLESWSVSRTRAVLASKTEAANRISSLRHCVFEKLENMEKCRLCDILKSTLHKINELFRNSLSQAAIGTQKSDKFLDLDDFDRVVESQTEILSVCEQIVQRASIEVTQLVFLIRCFRDSTLESHAYAAYDLLLRGLVTIIAISVCVFVNTGRCDFSDRVFIEATPAPLSSDRSEYGEIWESNLNVSLPSSPDLPVRLCRAVVKQGVLVRLLRTARDTDFEGHVNLLSLYNIAGTQITTDTLEELKKVSNIVENMLKEEVDVETLKNLVELVVSSSSMFNICAVVTTAILRDVRRMSDVIRHLIFCAGIDGFGKGVSRRSLIYKLRAELQARRFDCRHISAIDIGKPNLLESGTRRLLITPPEPLSVVITAGHARRYVRIYTFLADLTRAVTSLSEVELRETKVSVRNRRKLFAYCSSMLRVVTATRDHVLTELDAVWKLFKIYDLESVNTIDHAINAHRKAMKSMMQRTLLDIGGLTTARTLGVICESCVRFAHAMNAADEASSFIHYTVFEERAQLLRESVFMQACMGAFLLMRIVFYESIRPKACNQVTVKYMGVI